MTPEGEHSEDRGSIIIIVLLVGVLLVAALGIAVSAATSGLSLSNDFKTTSQQEMAAQTGLATTITTMRSVTNPSSLPCATSGSLGVVGANSSYSVTVQYFSSDSLLTCSGNGSTLGGTWTSAATLTATLISVGSAPHGGGATMKEDVNLTYTAGSTGVSGYAIYSPNTVDLQNAAVLNNGPGGTPDIYAGRSLTCNNATTSQGDVASSFSIVLSNSCTFDGSATTLGSVQLSNSATITGDVYSYNELATNSCPQSGGSNYAICLAGTATIGGNAWELNGSIEVPQGSIAKNAYASGSISVTTPGTVGGSQNPGYQFTTSTTPSSTPPSFPTFPYQTANLNGSPSGTTYGNTGWNGLPIITGQSSGSDTVWNVVTVAASQCSTFFASNNNEGTQLANGTWAVINPDPFQQALEAQTGPTVYYAPSCFGTIAPSGNNVKVSGSVVNYKNTQVFAIPTDTFLDVGSLAFQTTSVFCQESSTPGVCATTTSPGPNLILEANGAPPTANSAGQFIYTCSSSTLDEYFGQQSNFQSNVSVLLYTFGEIDYANAPSMTGQILACGGMTGTQTFTLVFDNSAFASITGPSGPSVQVTVNDKYLVRG